MTEGVENERDSVGKLNKQARRDPAPERNETIGTVQETNTGGEG